MSTTEAVLARFESQLGVTENPMGSNRVAYNDWYGIRPSPWCATFLSWCFFTEGLPLPASTTKGFAYTPSGAAWFRKQGRWTTKPARGHVVFFDFPGDGVDRISHVGIVTGVNADGSIDTIEGNTDERGGRTGGKVMRRRRLVGIVGYGIPRYTPISPSTPGSTYYPEDALRAHNIRVELGSDGTGWIYVDVPKTRIVNTEINGMDIAGKLQGQTGRAVVADSLAWGTGARVVLRASAPGTGVIDATVWAAEGPTSP